MSQTEERFLDQVAPEALTGCWLWVGDLYCRKLKNPYGRFWDGSKSVRAHRFSYQHFKGEIPEGLVIDHRCRNTTCVNPDHLRAVTVKENTIIGEGPSAQNSRKETCSKGHPLAPRTDGARVRRHCRVCSNSHQRAYLLRKSVTR